mmetsp:Transcript_11137/g.29625  ORF Transcript_11137/g.29625 Transcript_11137/m.29625 type:complete len:86 (+) Transcript_11137:542-799(+)
MQRLRKAWRHAAFNRNRYCQKALRVQGAAQQRTFRLHRGVGASETPLKPAFRLPWPVPGGPRHSSGRGTTVGSLPPTQGINATIA